MSSVLDLIDDEMIAAFEAEMMFWQRPAYNLAIRLAVNDTGVSEKEAKQFVIYQTMKDRPAIKKLLSEIAAIEGMRGKK